MAKKLTPEQVLTNQVNAEITKRNKLEAKATAKSNSISATAGDLLSLLTDAGTSEKKKITAALKAAEKIQKMASK